MTEIQQLIEQLQCALGIRVKCGVIALNMNEGQVASIETKVKMPVPRKAKQLTDTRPCG